MYVCTCYAVTEKEVEKHLKNGVSFVTLMTNAGSCCGCCIEYMEEMESKIESKLKNE